MAKPQYDLSASLEPCYDKPLTYEAEPKSSVPSSKSGDLAFIGRKHYRYIIGLHNTSEGLTGDPRNLPSPVDQKVKGALVMIDALVNPYMRSFGSGVITKDLAGDTVVVTAGHLPKDASLAAIDIVDSQGQESHPIGGCFMYQGSHKLVNFNKSAPRVDVAVLKLAAPIGSSVLELATEAPARGKWVIFENLQRGGTRRHPATYAGLVFNSQPQSLSFDVVTGLQSWRKQNYTLKHGASGGPVVNEHGELVGISTSFGHLGLIMGKKGLRQLDGVEISGVEIGHKTGLLPINGIVMHLNVLKAALNSSELKESALPLN